jgi:3-hydroxybutyrate dehydrogenase
MLGNSKLLSGKLALVTGSTSGIGLGIAHTLAEQGAHIVLHGFGEPTVIEALKAEFVEKYQVKVLFSDADLADSVQIKQLLALVSDAGGADIVINNAGIQHVASVEDFPLAMWQKVLAINLTAVFEITQGVLPAMRLKNWGRIINIASVHGLVASTHKAAYVAAKHGVLGLTKVVGLELAQTGVTCNAICPGWVLTPLVQQQIDAKAKVGNLDVEVAKKALLGEKQPSQEFVTPEALGALAVFLCSEAANQVRGAAWNMDGGWVAQ